MENTKKEKHQNYQKALIYVILISSALFFLSIKDAITTTNLYNHLELDKRLLFKINKKEKKTENELLLYGKLLDSNTDFVLRVYRPEFEKSRVNDTILFYKSKLGDETMTQYDISNHRIKHINGKGYSISYLIAFMCLIISIASILVFRKLNFKNRKL